MAHSRSRDYRDFHEGRQGVFLKFNLIERWGTKVKLYPASTQKGTTKKERQTNLLKGLNPHP